MQEQHEDDSAIGVRSHLEGGQAVPAFPNGPQPLETYSSTLPVSDELVGVDERYVATDGSLIEVKRWGDVQAVEEYLRQFDSMSPAEQRLALARVFNVDPDKAAIVRRPDGALEMREVSREAKARIEAMGRQGFSAVSFTNRKARRAAAAQERASKRSAAASSRAK
jgi:hypothetical protein